MPDPSKGSSLSRRSLLAGLATMPALFVATRSRADQTAGCDAVAKEAQTALKNASGTNSSCLALAPG